MTSQHRRVRINKSPIGDYSDSSELPVTRASPRGGQPRRHRPSFPRRSSRSASAPPGVRSPSGGAFAARPLPLPGPSVAPPPLSPLCDPHCYSDGPKAVAVYVLRPPASLLL
jgi:hypothetical protein